MVVVTEEVTMKSFLSILAVGLVLILASTLVMAEKAPAYPELEVSYDRATDSAHFSAWSGAVDAGVAYTSDETSKQKTLYHVKLITSAGTSSKFVVKANEYIEDNAKVRAYKITTMNYNGKVDNENVKKMQVVSQGHTIYQRYINVETQEIVKEIKYDDNKGKSVVYEKINGVFQKTGTYNGFATLMMYTKNGHIQAYVVPPMSN